MRFNAEWCPVIVAFWRCSQLTMSAGLFIGVYQEKQTAKQNEYHIPVCTALGWQQNIVGALSSNHLVGFDRGKQSVALGITILLRQDSPDYQDIFCLSWWKAEIPIPLRRMWKIKAPSFSYEQCMLASNNLPRSGIVFHRVHQERDENKEIMLILLILSKK